MKKKTLPVSPSGAAQLKAWASKGMQERHAEQDRCGFHIDAIEEVESFLRFCRSGPPDQAMILQENYGAAQARVRLQHLVQVLRGYGVQMPKIRKCEVALYYARRQLMCIRASEGEAREQEMRFLSALLASETFDARFHDFIWNDEARKLITGRTEAPRLLAFVCIQTGALDFLRNPRIATHDRHELDTVADALRKSVGEIRVKRNSRKKMFDLDEE